MTGDTGEWRRGMVAPPVRIKEQDENITMTIRRTVAGVAAALMVVSAQVQAGVALGATRVIYQADQKQVSLGVNNSDDRNTFLIQSWVENSDGKKDGRFVITPPLFVMQGKKENTLRIIDATNHSLPADRKACSGSTLKPFHLWTKAR
jgi:fimbrial chaperone protein